MRMRLGWAVMSATLELAAALACCPWKTQYLDPPHPSCDTTPPSARFALALYGGISGRTRFRPSGQIYRDHNASEYSRGTIEATHRDLRDFVVIPSGGEVDIFIHGTVPSSELQAQLIALYQPVSVRTLLTASDTRVHTLVTPKS